MTLLLLPLPYKKIFDKEDKLTQNVEIYHLITYRGRTSKEFGSEYSNGTGFDEKYLDRIFKIFQRLQPRDKDRGWRGNKMDDQIIKILYVEDNIEDVLLIKEFIKEIKNVHYELTHAQQLNEALLEIENDNYDIIMLDLSLPDKQGLDIITRVCERAPDIPVVVMTGMDDETMAIKALQKGAEEYLVKGKVKSHSLSRILRYAIMRHKGRVELHSLSLIDDLTSLYNRKGFMLFAQQQLSIAVRTKRGMLLFLSLWTVLRKSMINLAINMETWR